MTVAHLDDSGQPCTRHPVAAIEKLLALALAGSRAPGFHHDLASKLQGLMMSIEEIAEIGGDPQIQRATETAQLALHEILAMLNASRALTKPAIRTRVQLSELIAQASERVYVTCRGAVPEVTVEVAVPATIHALSLLLDVAGGPGRGRSIDALFTPAPTTIEIALAASGAPPSNAAESLALATFVLGRDQGELRCAVDGSRFVVRIPVVT